MKICILYKFSDKAWGGANSFLRSLAKQLIRLGHEVFTTPNHCADIILINSWAYSPSLRLSPELVKKLKQHGKITLLNRLPLINYLYNYPSNMVPIIHRLDGIAKLYGRNDDSDNIQIRINKFTDYTIFQSDFCRKSFLSVDVNPQHFAVIYNGVDQSIFFPLNETKKIGKTLKALAVSWSSNPKKGFFFLKEFADMPNVLLTFIGNWPDSEPKGNVNVIGVKNSYEIAALMRQNDIFIHAAENDPCPNVVIEALSSGLPIIYKDSGGTPELAKDYGIPFNSNSDITYSLEAMKDRYEELRAKILNDMYLFSIERAAKQYLEVFEKAISMKKS